MVCRDFNKQEIKTINSRHLTNVQIHIMIIQKRKNR